MVLDIIASVAGLITFAEKLVTLLSSLQGCGPKCAALLQNMRTLKDALERVRTEYKKTLALLDTLNGKSSSLSISDGLLNGCLSDCSITCRDYEALLSRIAKSRTRALKWRMAEGDLMHCSARLEANKSTLMMVLASISEERQRCVQEAYLKPPVQSSTPAPTPAPAPSPPPSYNEAIAKPDLPKLNQSTSINATGGALIGQSVGALTAAATLATPIGWLGLGIWGAGAAAGALLGSAAGDVQKSTRLCEELRSTGYVDPRGLGGGNPLLSGYPPMDTSNLLSNGELSKFKLGDKSWRLPEDFKTSYPG